MNTFIRQSERHRQRKTDIYNNKHNQAHSCKTGTTND